MRAWVAAIAMLSVLALGAGCSRDTARDHGHATHAHAVLASTSLATRRAAPVTVDVAVPPQVVLAAPSRTFVRTATAAPVTAASLRHATRCGARAPPCA